METRSPLLGPVGPHQGSFAGGRPVHEAYVLVVDDEAENRMLVRRALKRAGYRIGEAANGDEALAAVAAQPPDLVLLDVAMPGPDGFVVCRSIKDDPRTRFVPVVLVTGMHSREHKIRGIQAGADDFLLKPFDPEELMARSHSLIRLKRSTDDLDSAESVIRSLALTIEARDPYTDGHCQRLAEYSTRLGVELGLGGEELSALEQGGYLHDVGKVGIPDAVLLKAGPLTPSEYELMKSHTIIGDRLCGELRSLRLVRSIVRHHHERLDGSGYPDGLRGDELPLLAQIVSIADLYDAVTTVRPYRQAQSGERACEELMREARLGLRRTDLVEAFVRLSRTAALQRAGDNLPNIGPSR